MDARHVDTAVLDFIERCAVGFVIGTDRHGAPHVGCLSVAAGFAALVDRGTLAIRLPAGEFEADTFYLDRVTLLLIDVAHRRHLLLDGTWQELPAGRLVADVRRRLGIRGRGSRSEVVGILDVAGVRWCRASKRHLGAASPPYRTPTGPQE